MVDEKMEDCDSGKKWEEILMKRYITLGSLGVKCLDVTWLAFGFS